MEVRPVGVTKGLAMQRLMGLIAEMEGRDKASYEFVMCIGERGRTWGGGKRVGEEVLWNGV